jgi:hypothetical protein
MNMRIFWSNKGLEKIKEEWVRNGLGANLGECRGWRWWKDDD